MIVIYSLRYCNYLLPIYTAAERWTVYCADRYVAHCGPLSVKNLVEYVGLLKIMSAGHGIGVVVIIIPTVYDAMVQYVLFHLWLYIWLLYRITVLSIVIYSDCHFILDLVSIYSKIQFTTIESLLKVPSTVWGCRVSSTVRYVAV